MQKETVKAYITDYIKNPDIEKDVLSEYLTDNLCDDVAVLLVWHENIDKAYMDKLPNLRGIVRYGVGYDNIDLEYASKRGIYVCNTPDYGTEEVSDSAVAMILNAARGISRYDSICRDFSDGTWQENTIEHIRRNSDMTLGVIGAGRIGSGVLLRAGALRFQTAFFDPYKERGHEKVLNAKRCESLSELLSECDIISVHTPLNKETKGMINKETISLMKHGASFVNTARGGIVDCLDDFCTPLKDGRLSSVSLDVLPDEPPLETELIKAWKKREDWIDGRLIINPHTAYYSRQAYVEMRRKTAQNALNIINNVKPWNIIPH